MAVDILHQVLKENYGFHVDDKYGPHLICFKNGYQGGHSYVICFCVQSTEKKRYRNSNRDKRFSKIAGSNLKKTKQIQNDHSPLAEGRHNIWTHSLFRDMSVKDWYAAVTKMMASVIRVRVGHTIKHCKSTLGT